MTKATTIRDRIVSFCSRPGGASKAELQAAMGSIASTIPTHVGRLEGQGRLCRAKAVGQLLRFFSSTSDRDEWLVTSRATANPRQTAKVIPIIAKRPLPHENYTAGASRVAPATKGQPIITAKTIFTIIPCRSMCARYQAQPSQPIFGFTSMGIGRYL